MCNVFKFFPFVLVFKFNPRHQFWEKTGWDKQSVPQPKSQAAKQNKLSMFPTKR
jgi:hypothetical protein